MRVNQTADKLIVTETGLWRLSDAFIYIVLVYQLLSKTTLVDVWWASLPVATAIIGFAVYNIISYKSYRLELVPAGQCTLIVKNVVGKKSIMTFNTSEVAKVNLDETLPALTSYTMHIGSSIEFVFLDGREIVVSDSQMHLLNPLNYLLMPFIGRMPDKYIEHVAAFVQKPLYHSNFH
ncbi:MAG: hypothetical protein JWM00_700 [Candidatus Saccharibacteria bacterium]|nr:hypothetical protein [Candidatus Saccharibacteria bacterium]